MHLHRHGSGLLSSFVTLLLLLNFNESVRAQSNRQALLGAARALPAAPPALVQPDDWLVVPVQQKAAVYRGENPAEIVLDNGLLRRTFRVLPNAATVGFDNLRTGASVIRSLEPEAILTLDGVEVAVGGLVGEPDRAYLLPEWIDQLQAGTNAFQCVGFEPGRAKAPVPWKQKRHAEDVPWPPAGVSLTFHYASAAPRWERLKVAVHYELYDNLPVWCKWITLHNGGARPVRLTTFTSECLAAVEAGSYVEMQKDQSWLLPGIVFLSDYNFKGQDYVQGSQTMQWLPDPRYTTQVNYQLATPSVVVSRPPLGPNLVIAPGGDFESFRTCGVVYDSTERERQGLTLRRAERRLAPWVTENPIMMHVRSADTKTFRAAVDQCAEVGFEMIIYTFGSGLNMENEDPAYLARVKADVDYAHAKGIEVGAYSLLASRHIDDENDVINPRTGKPGGAIFGYSPCLGSEWAAEYFRKIKHFIEVTGLDLLEHDGSYPGDVCASTKHPGHAGLEDSQWQQWRIITDFYKWCRARGMYLNVPDTYFLAGSNKTGMGYRESNWSLPRDRQIIHGRQNIYDGTWSKTPSMGWMFVPLVEYHGGGAAATLEPLKDHLDAYAAHLANNFGAGVQACYRGPRLYDSDETQAVVRRWVAWFKRHRDILESDLIHLRRPDGRDIDAWLHVNPALHERAMAVVYNPLDQEAERTLTLPLYDAGLQDQALVREQEGRARKYSLDRQYRLRVPVRLKPHEVTWLIMEKP